MTRSILYFTLLAALMPASSGHTADESGGLHHMDTKTRCIVLLRDVLLHLRASDFTQVLPIIADGRGNNDFVLPPADAVKAISPADEKHLLGEFPQHDVVFKAFDRILFSDLATTTEGVTVRQNKSGKGLPAKLHVMQVRIPGISDERFQEIRFVEAGGRLYWVPFGW